MIKAVIFDFFGVIRGRELDAQVLRLIRALRQNYLICLLSNSPRGVVREILEGNGIETLFDEIIISGEVNLLKPDPKIFALALERLGATAAEVVFVDDDPANIAAGHSLGITGITFVSARHLATDLRGQGLKL